MRAPRLLAAGTAAACLVLSGCGLDKPSPLVSVVSGGTVKHSEATTYCFEGQDPAKEPGSEGGCSFTESQPTLIEVRAGDQVGIDVAKPLADAAWVAVLSPQAGGSNGAQRQKQSSPVQEGHYFAFTPSFNGGPLDLQVQSLASDEPNAAVTGIWRFVLAPK